MSGTGLGLCAHLCSLHVVGCSSSRRSFPPGIGGRANGDRGVALRSRGWATAFGPVRLLPHAAGIPNTRCGTAEVGAGPWEAEDATRTLRFMAPLWWAGPRRARSPKSHSLTVRRTIPMHRARPMADHLRAGSPSGGEAGPHPGVVRAPSRCPGGAWPVAPGGWPVAFRAGRPRETQRARRRVRGAHRRSRTTSLDRDTITDLRDKDGTWTADTLRICAAGYAPAATAPSRTSTTAPACPMPSRRCATR